MDHHAHHMNTAADVATTLSPHSHHNMGAADDHSGHGDHGSDHGSSDSSHSMMMMYVSIEFKIYKCMHFYSYYQCT